MKSLNIIGLPEINFRENFKIRQTELDEISTIDQNIRILDNAKKVPDVYRYNLKYNINTKKWGIYSLENSLQYNKRSRFIDAKIENVIDASVDTIVFILESPHKDEYDENMNPRGPAQGITGTKLEKNFLKKMQAELEKTKEYRFIISNPVPYQTSLHCLHGKKLQGPYATLRNRVWSALMEQNEIQEDFVTRLDSYNANIVINGCTSKLKQKIKNLLDDKGIESISSFHPSSWR